MGNGRIIGSRSLKYIYKQRFRPTDNREAIVVNKLSVEYRKIQAIANGETTSHVAKGSISQEIIHDYVKMWRRKMINDNRVSARKNMDVPRPVM